MKQSHVLRQIGTGERRVRVLSLHAFLTRLICFCVLPLVLLAVFVGIGHLYAMREQLDRQAADQAQNVADTVDRQIEAQIAALQMLAGSPLMDDPVRLSEFYNEVRGFREGFGGDVILADLSKQMIFNTRVPLGEPLPKLPEQRGHPAADAVVSTGKPQVTDVFFGPVAKRTLVSVVVPLTRNGEMKFLLLCTMDTHQFQQNLDKVALPVEWSVTVRDRRAEIVARRSPPGTENNDRSGVEASSCFASKSAATNWSIVVEIPPHVYRSPIISAALELSAAILAISFVSLFGARLFSRRLAQSVATLTAVGSPRDSRPVIAEIEAAQKLLHDAEVARSASELKLRESQQGFRQLFETAPVPLCLVNRDGVLETFNARFEQTFGYARGDVPTLSEWWLLAYPDADYRHWAMETWESAVHAARENDTAIGSIENRVICKDGKVLTVEISASILGDDLLATFFDISERKRSEDALRRSRHDLNRAQAVARIGSWRIDVHRNTLLWSDETYRMFGFPKGSPLTYETFMGIVHPEDRDYVDRQWTAARNGAAYDIEHRILVSGSVKWVREKAELEFDEDGSLLGGFGTVQDITELKRAEAALRESREEYAIVFNQSPIAIVFFNAKGELVMVNQACLEMFGVVDPLEIIGFKLFEDPNVDEAIKDRLLKGEAVRSEGEFDFEKVKSLGLYKTTRSGVRLLDRIISPIRDGSRMDGYIVQVQDITERKRAELEKDKLESQLRQAQKLEAIGTLAGGIAHDFNNILAAIIGYSEMALDEVPHVSSLKLDLQQILNAGYRAKELVRQILTFSRQTAREPRPIEITYIVKEALKMLRATLPSTIVIAQKIALTARTRVMADPTEIHQVVMNLCTNAAYSMRAKGGQLEVELDEVTLSQGQVFARLDLVPGEYVRLRVCDTGHGMSEDVVAKIFDPFFTTKPLGEGTGMGLSVLHGIVKRCNGAITVESHPGEGSIFCVYLPKLLLEPQEEVDDAVEEPVGKGRILLVDDEKPIVEMGRRMLERLGYHVTSRTSSQEALEAIKSMPYWFDLLLTDYTMPSMTGLDLAREVKRIRPGLPVIVCSGHNEILNEKTAFSFDIEGFIAKPFNRRELSKVIQTVLEGV